MNKLIPQQEYYVSDMSIGVALHGCTKRIFIGEDSRGVLWFEGTGGSGAVVCWRFAEPIPKPAYTPWDAKTRPLGGAYKRKEDGNILIPTNYSEYLVYLGGHWHSYRALIKDFDYIPDLTKEHETVPCGVLKGE